MRYSIISFLVLSGCAKFGNHYSVMIDPSFSDDQKTEIVSGLDDWERKVGTALSFDISFGNCNMTDNDSLICIHSSTYFDNILKSYSPNPLGWTNRSDYNDSADCWISTDEMSKPNVKQYFFRVLQHEEGHAMGLVHTPVSEHTVMCYSAGCEPESVLCQDVAQWGALRGWNIPCSL